MNSKPVVSARPAPMRRQLLIAGVCAFTALPALAQAPFDHGHAAWTQLLKKHVVLQDGGKASQLRYAGMAADRAALTAYTSSLSAVRDRKSVV